MNEILKLFAEKKLNQMSIDVKIDSGEIILRIWAHFNPLDAKENISIEERFSKNDFDLISKNEDQINSMFNRYISAMTRKMDRLANDRAVK